jgi:hypothetical protein
VKIQHDGDGKLFYIKDGTMHWVVECDIASGDAVASAFTRLMESAPSATTNSAMDAIAERYISEVAFLDSSDAGVVRSFVAYLQQQHQ